VTAAPGAKGCDVAVFRTGIRSAVLRGAAAVAVLAVAVSLTGCAPLQLGAAAIIGTQRISTSRLSSDVAALNKVYQAHPALRAQVQYKPAQMPRLVLMWLVRFGIIADIARHDGVRVTPAQAQSALVAADVAVERQIRASVSPAEFGLLSALPPNLTSQYGRYRATIERLAMLFTGVTDLSSLTQAQQQRFAARVSSEVAAAVKRLKIKINPRFGRLNAAQLTVVAAPDRLSRPAPAA